MIEEKEEGESKKQKKIKESRIIGLPEGVEITYYSHGFTVKHPGGQRVYLSKWEHVLNELLLIYSTRKRHRYDDVAGLIRTIQDASETVIECTKAINQSMYDELTSTMKEMEDGAGEDSDNDTSDVPVEEQDIQALDDGEEGETKFSDSSHDVCKSCYEQEQVGDVQVSRGG